jgi:type IV pilus assembly protein PilF
VTRQLLTIIFLCFSGLVLTACSYNPTYTVDYPNLASARYNAEQGLKYTHLGRTDLAHEKFELAMQQAPHDPLVLDALAYYYEKTGNIDLANVTYFRALTLDPRSGVLRNNYGAFLCRNGYPQESIQYFMKASEVPHYAGSIDAYANARYCAEKLGANSEYAYYTTILWKPTSRQVSR